MEHQWRPIPATHANNICPICSVSHFPFCLPYPNPPPPLPYSQNPRFPPSRPDYTRADPFPSGPPNPCLVIPDHGFQGDREEGYGQPMYEYYYYNRNNGGEADRSYKRPKVDDGIGSGKQNHQNPDDERRLKLIRDHGNASLDLSDTKLQYSQNDASNLYSPFRPTQDVVNKNNYNWQNHSMANYSARQQQLPIDFTHSLPAQRGYLPYHDSNRAFGGQLPPPPPPLPASPPPPLPMEPPVHPSPPKSSFSLFPVPISSSATNPHFHSKSTAFVSEDWQQSSGQTFFPKQLSPVRPIVVDASHLFKPPHRATRPNHIVIILRGLPGSGKSYLAKMMRNLEVENGGTAPRIHSMDDYFMTEVEKVEETDGSKSSSTTRGKKSTVKKVMEYCYEPEMEEAYRDSMLKAFKKTLEEGVFTFVIVDDRNLRVADFAQFWAFAKRSGYEVYILEATYKDPAGCAARNVHGFSRDEIQRMAGQWEEAPSLYARLDTKSLFHGDDLKQSGIQEVDMDSEDGDFGDDTSRLQERTPEKMIVPPIEDDSSCDGKELDAEEDNLIGLKDLGKSKWSDDLDEDNSDGSEGMRASIAVSGLIQAYPKKRKSVRWSDQVGCTGFSIGIVKKANTFSLVIGPGAGYNLKSNPLSESESPTSNLSTNGKSSRRSIFQERLRVEHESFRAVFDRRKQRIGGLDFEE